MKSNDLTLLKFAIVFFLIWSFGCSTKKKQEDSTPPGVVENDTIYVLTEAMDFQTVDTLQPGWNTFKWSNESEEVHLFLMDKYPEGKRLEDAEEEIIPVFQDAMNLINEGKAEEGFAEFGKLPEWGQQITYLGGSGLLSPHKTSITTIHLDPGYYVMECYVKMVNGVFHTTMGMAKEIIVTGQNNDLNPPTGTVKVSISSDSGLTFNGKVTVGRQIFSVFFEDQAVYEHFLGHDVNLVKLEASSSLEALEAWMDWTKPDGLRTPAPQGVLYMGGVNDCPAGSKGYFVADITPGKYALIAEVPAASSKNMLKKFEVSP